jgi:hypothetical protein
MKPAAQKSNWAIVLWLCVVGTNCSQEAAEPPFTLRQIGPGAWAAIDNPKSASPAAANAGFVIGDAGVTVIDTFWSVDAARQLLAEIQRRTPLPASSTPTTTWTTLQETAFLLEREPSSLAIATCATGFTPRTCDCLAPISLPN